MRRRPKTPLAAWIRENRRRLGLTSGQVAARLGVADVTVRSWEAGRGVSEENLDALEHLYDREAPGGEPASPDQAEIAAAIDRQTAALAAVLTKLGELVEAARQQAHEERDAILDAVADVRAALPAPGTGAAPEHRARTSSGRR